MNTFFKRSAVALGIVLFGLAFAAVVLAQSVGITPAEIRGRILDGESQEPIQGANVSLVGTQWGAVTDADGRFVISEVPEGTYALRALRLGYKAFLKEGVEVRAGQALTLDIAMSRNALQLSEITVTPGAFSFMGSGAAMRQAMSREDIESVPQLGEDVFRAVNRLPGLSSGDYSAHFSIRGGRHDETLILFDGLELYEPYHLKDFNEGAISIVDVEAIDGVQLMTGGFPAQYGNKRSGVFDITSRTPETDHARMSVGLSFMNGRAMARGPLRNGRGSWLALARSGYMDLVFGIIKQNDLPSPRYYDAYGKVQYDLSPNQSLSLNILHAGDRYTFDAASTTGFLDSLPTRENARNHYANSYVWSTLKSTLGQKTVVRTMVSGALVTRTRDGAELYVNRTEPLYTISGDRDFSVLGFKQDWTQALSDVYALSYGVDARRLHNKDRFASVVNQDPNDPTADPSGVYPVRTSSSIESSGTRLSLYLSNRLRVLEPLVVEVGGRYDRATYTGDKDFSPRVSAALSLGPQRTLRLGWGKYRQIQGIDDVTALDLGRRFFPSELSQQWTAGLEQHFGSGALLRAEVYYKEGSHLRPVYRNWKSGIDTFPESNEDRILVYPTANLSRGLELYFDHRLAEKLKMRASYALSSGSEDVTRIVSVNTPDSLSYDLTHPIPQDQRHAANVDFTYQWRRAWSINGSFAYHSGWLATLEQLVPVVDEEGDSDVAIRPVKIYGARLPSYFRFDVRATRRWSTSHGDMRFFVELVNVTNHSNVFGYDYFRAHNATGGIELRREEETWFTILPSLGVAWTRSF